MLSFAIIACEDENESIPYEGKDNFITDIKIHAEDDKVLSPIIANGEIVLAMPYQQSLEGARVDFQLSENAEITPNPADKTDWAEDCEFVVTSYNKEVQTYKYRVVRTEEESVTLNTQAEVDAYAANKVNIIKGSLTIAKTATEDTITSLAGLSSLTEISYNLVIGQYYGARSLKGLENVTKIGSFYFNYTNSTSLTIDLPSLKTVGTTFIFTAPMAVDTVNLESLEYVGGIFNIYSKVFKKINLSKVRAAGSDFIVRAYNGASPEISTLDLSSLKSVEGALKIDNLTALSNLNLSSLESVNGVITFINLEGIDKFDLSKIVAGGIDVTVLTNPSEVVVSDNFNGSFAYTSNTCTEFPVIKNLKNTKGLKFMLRAYEGDIVMNDIETVDGLLWLNYCMKVKNIKFPKLKEAQGIQPYFCKELVKFELPELTKLTGYCPSTITNSYSAIDANLSSFAKLEKISMPKLEEAKGDMKFSSISSTAPILTINVGSLKAIDGQLHLSSKSSSSNTNFKSFEGFSALTSVKSVEIKNFKGIESFEPFKNVISTLDESTWKVSGCTYNPTYQDMVDAKYNQ